MKPDVRLKSPIASEFGLGAWNQGFVIRPGHVFLLVTLEKGELVSDHRYVDRFLSPTAFQWQSQNRTTQESGSGQLIRDHEDQGHQVHLFVRRNKKIGNKAAPVVYCGELDFVSWKGERPITVQWRLRQAVPQHFWKLLKVPVEER